MSLSSLLGGGGSGSAKSKKDDALDAIFAKSTGAPVAAPLAGKVSCTASLSSDRMLMVVACGQPTLKLASSSSKPAGAKNIDKSIRPPEQIIQAANQAKRKNSDRLAGAGAAAGAGSPADKASKKRQKLDRPSSKLQKTATAAPDASDEDEEGDDDVPVILEASEDSDSDVDPSTLVHEADLKAGAKVSNGKGKSVNGAAAKKKLARQDEDPADRDARTTFVGNVPVACATEKVSGRHSL